MAECKTLTIEDSTGSGREKLDQAAKITQRKTLSIEEAAKELGISRNAGYEAARRGEIPTVQIGRRKLVPIKPFLRMLGDDE